MPSTASPACAAPAPAVAWRVQLLGGPQAVRGATSLTHFGSRSVAALLARLALYPQRHHAREELIELLWPGVELDIGRNRLRQTLFTLRQLIEPPGSAPVLLADRSGVRVAPDALLCDATQFERLLRDGRHAEALTLYRGELLPGFYEDWIADERMRLAALFDRIDVDALPLLPQAAPPVPSPPSPAERPPPLPVYLTRFFGRETEAARLHDEVNQHRLVTLLGPGGSGKTRLAVELAAALRPSARFDRVAFVPLVGCATGAQALAALGAALQIPPRGDDAMATLQAAFTGQRVLIVLDNFEQLAGAAEDLIARLGNALPGLHLLVTSRRVLGIDGEREFIVQPLALPAAGTLPGEAAANPAVALFLDRARAVRADFQLTSSNEAAVVDLVQLLEGMPLAIELAAARMRSLAPAEIAGLLRIARQDGGALELLARNGPRAGLDPRHASMQQVIDWSWRLLQPEQARLLAALTVFRGSFTAQAVRAVCAATMALSASGVAVALDDLVMHSLLRVADTGIGSAGLRFALYEPIREFAAARLDAVDARTLRGAHRTWLAAWSRSLPTTPPLAEFRAETPNLLAALASALADDAPCEALRMAVPLRRVLEDVELPADGLAMLEAALARCTDAGDRAAGHVLLGPLLFVAGRGADALRHVEAGLALAPPGAALRGRALHAAARVRWRVQRDAAAVEALLDEAQALAEVESDDELLASVHALRAFVTNTRRADRAVGEALHARALALWERLGNQHAVNSGRYNLVVCALNDGRFLEALARLDRLTDSARQQHDMRRLRQTLNVRGLALCGLRHWADGSQALREGVRLAWDGNALHDLGLALWNLPRALAHERRAEPALQLAGFVERFWPMHFGPLSASDRRDLLRVRRLGARQLEASACEAAWQRGAALSVADAVALALSA